MFKTLIVDDNEDFRQSLIELLSKRYPAMDISQATCGKEARKTMERLTPHLIFMDIRLPDENGLEVSKQIKFLNPNIDLVIMSSFDIPEYRNAAEKSGAIYFLAKETLSHSIYDLFNNVLMRIN